MSGTNGFGFWSGVARGLAASLEVYAPTVPLDSRSDVEKMRGDWARIGQDFKVVIARTNGESDDR